MDKLQQIETILNDNTLAEVHDFNLVYELSPPIQSFIDQAYEDSEQAEKVEELETKISDLEVDLVNLETEHDREQERADILSDELDRQQDELTEKIYFWERLYEAEKETSYELQKQLQEMTDWKDRIEERYNTLVNSLADINKE